MRLILAAMAASAIVTSGLAAVPASRAATLAPVGAVTVTPSTGNDGTSFVDVSWASEPSNADGALVCLHRGTTAVQTPTGCESRVPVTAPALDSGPITVRPGKNYMVEVFSYQASSPIAYGPPVMRLRHGVKVAMTSRCGDQTAGSTCRVIGTVTDVYTGAKLANRKLQLWMSREQQPAKWTLAATRTTVKGGTAQAAIMLTKTRLYQWHYTAQRSHELSSNSARLDVVVSH